MADREARDLARKERRVTPKKPAKTSSDNKENEMKPAKKKLSYAMKKSSKEDEFNDDTEEVKSNEKTDENSNNFDHPIYKEISKKNGVINRSDLSTLKRMCREEGVDSSGKRDMVKQRLKQLYKTRLLREAGLLPGHQRGYDFYLVVDFEATCEERNAPEFPHEIIEFPGVIVDGRTGQQVSSWREYVRPLLRPELSPFCTSLTGITQETVDAADTFPSVLHRFSEWLEQEGLGTSSTFALVTDGPFDVGRFLRLACQQAEVEVPPWATHWVNVRKAFANFYRTNSGSAGQLRLPGLSTMLDKLSLQFQGSPHSGLDDAVNIARVVARLVADGAVLKVNERLSPVPLEEGEGGRPRQLPYVTSVSKAAAEAWGRSCRYELTDPAAQED